jgi:hypothetical protein
MAVAPPPSAPGNGAVTSGHFSDQIAIEMLDVNLTEYGSAESVGVRFYPNGTSDEMTIILRSAAGEWRKIALEITTGLTTVELDPNRFR